MTSAVSLVFAALLLLSSAAAAADTAACTMSKDLYEEWASGGKTGGVAAATSAPLIGSAASMQPPAKRQVIEQYRAFFESVSSSASRKDNTAVDSCCKAASADRLASLVCNMVEYLKDGRVDSKPFLEGFPSGKKGAEMIWDLDSIANAGQTRSGAPELFLPKGPAYKLIDELFLLVLDGNEQAIVKYFALSSHATGEADRYMNQQIKLLLRESPSVVVSQWLILRQYRPKLKTLVGELSGSLSAVDLQRMRRGFKSFCENDGPDCQEIQKVVGR